MSLPAVRRTLLLAGLGLIAGLLVEPALPPSLMFAASIAWYLALVLCSGALCVLVTRRAGRAAAVAVLALGLGAPIVLTALPAPPEIAVHLPCPRNWAWLPTWQLRSSPMGSVSFTVDGAPVKVCYGRPAARGRTMLGGRRVPFGRLWRTGASGGPHPELSRRPEPSSELRELRRIRAFSFAYSMPRIPGAWMSERDRLLGRPNGTQSNRLFAYDQKPSCSRSR